MAKEFYTEKDIEDLFKRGVTSLEVGEDTVLTELAYEKANRLGMKLVRDRADSPPSAPVRPYLSGQPQAPRPARAQPVASSTATPLTSSQRLPQVSTPKFETPRAVSAQDGGDLHQRIRNAVIARMGTQIDQNLLDAIIKRVLTSTGVK
jgi:hypothetical protein